MKKLGLLFTMVGAAFLLTTNVMAQDTGEAGEAVTYSLPAMKILDIEGTAPSLTFAAPAEAGTAVEPVTDNASWLNYTSVIATGTTNKVTCVLSGTAVPTSTVLKVTAAAHAGTGNGTYGTTANQVTLSTSAVDVITGIGSCWTGDGNLNGHQLTYEWSITSSAYAALVTAGAADITATYTIIAN